MYTSIHASTNTNAAGWCGVCKYQTHTHTHALSHTHTLSMCVQGLAGVGVFVLSSQDKLEEKKRDGDEEGADDKVLL